MDKPSAQVVAKIEGLKDLIELDTPIKNNWRSSNQESRWKQDKQVLPPRNVHKPLGVCGRYVSKFKKEEEVDNKILQNIILSKLNKFSEKTYNEIREFLYQILGSDDPGLAELIRDFMQLVFRKGIHETMYCSLYAKLLCELSLKYPVLKEEMAKLQTNYMNIFTNEENNTSYRQGYSQFIAELVAFDCLEIPILKRIFQTILDQIMKLKDDSENRAAIDQYIDCMYRMTNVLKNKTNDFSKSVKNELKGVISDFIASGSTYPGVSTKSRFICMNIRDILEI
jgi:hypothetical protein